MIGAASGSAGDPYALRAFGRSDNFEGIGWKDTNGLAQRNAAPDPTKKTLVLITSGQSVLTNSVPSFVAPANPTVVDQHNIYDGSNYSIGGPILGCTYAGSGNISPLVADKFIPTFDRVILCAIAIGSTSVRDWAIGDLSNRLPVLMRRLAARGITPATTGVTFANVFSDGQQDAILGTSQSDWQALFGVMLSNAVAAGFSGRTFVNLDTWSSGSNPTIRAAQAGVVNGTTIFAGGDLDTITGGTNRQGNGPHFADAGSPLAATLIYNAMHASGAPF